MLSTDGALQASFSNRKTQRLMTGKQEEQPLQQVISDLFRDFKEDETGGQHASRGFNFQVWHAVLEALKAYKSGQDYAVVLEWQQDVAVLDSSTSPTSVRFLQLKKNERSIHWTLNQISAPEQGDDTPPANDADIGVSNATGADNADSAPARKGRKAKAKPKKSKPSFLAKLYQHRRRFKDLALSRLEFVSNARFEITDSSGGLKMLHGVELMDLDNKVREDLEKKVRIQLELPADEVIDFTDVGLVVSDCPMTDAHKHVAGELAEMQIADDLKLSGAATMIAVLVIAAYVHQRAGTLRFAKNLQELLARAVTRNDISRYLAAANDARVSTEDMVLDVISRLNVEVAPFATVNKMKRELSRTCVDITNRAGPVPMVAAHLKLLYETKPAYQAIPKVIDLFAAWYEDFLNLSLPHAHLYGREYLYCLMSMIIQDAHPIQHLPPVSTGPQLEDKE